MSRFEKVIPRPMHEITRDPLTGLEWQATPFPESMIWAKAHKACAEMRLGGHSDWRLPTRLELLSIVDDTLHNPAIDTDSFPGTPSDWFWTSTPSARNPGCAWIISFSQGVSQLDFRSAGFRVRAVRGPV